MEVRRPDVNVIIPTFNRRDALVETLRRLLAQDLRQGDWEALVIDDGSTDGTEAAVRDLAAGTPIRYVRQANAGPAAARNRGAAEAAGRYLIFIDNDILVEPNFIRSHVAALEANPGCWILGRITHPDQLRATPFGRYRDALWESFHNSHPDVGGRETDGISAANLSLPRADFLRFGGFDTDFTIASSEDWELGFRARQAGVRVLYYPAITVVHNDWAVSLDRFCERQRLYSLSDVLLWAKWGAASPRAGLVRENGPVRWSADGPRLVAKKLAKWLLARRPGRAVVHGTARVLERVVPDGRLCRAAYRTAVALAIFRGVREGFRRYRPAAPVSHPAAVPIAHG
jgi:GT2 family glycosyltransferase